MGAGPRARRGSRSRAGTRADRRGGPRAGPRAGLGHRAAQSRSRSFHGAPGGARRGGQARRRGVNDVADDVRVDPGAESEAEIRVRNTGSIVDRISLQVEGPAARWASVDPPTVNLYPGAEATARLRFSPP